MSDWTNLTEVVPLRFCCARGDSSVTTSLSTGVLTTAPLTTWIARNDSSLYEFSNNGIKINESGTYIIACGIYLKSSSSATYANRQVYIINNQGAEILSASCGTDGQGAEGGICAGSKTMALIAGDVIYLKGRIYGSTGTMYAGNNSSYLTIVKL